MIATHSVKMNGVWFRAGDFLPLPSSASEPIRVSENKESMPVYKKNDINRMPVAELKELASTMGIESYETMNGAGLKKSLIEALGL